MGWQYIHDLLPLYGFPPRFVKWVMSCVRAAEFTLVINGRGDGFFKPTCGLRQGCALSSYLFIIGMDLLSRGFQFLSNNQLIKGVKLTPAAIPITNCVYTNDLLIFGSATGEEAGQIMNLLALFQSISGQRVGPDKSSLWFSSFTSQSQRLEVGRILRVQGSDPSSKYLGTLVNTGTGSHDFILEKFLSKLEAWKSNTLS